jgi:uncharacterized FlgJ-related protein
MKRLVLCLVLFLFVLYPRTVSRTSHVVAQVVTEFSESNLITYMRKIGIVYPDIVLAQAKIETGNFTSVIFKENNNLFGMKVARSRPTTAVGKSRNHAVYETWLLSLIDYKLWQDKMIHRAPTKRKYLEYLSRNYAEDKTYVRKIKNLL